MIAALRRWSRLVALPHTVFALPFALGAGAPEVAGELEYYARISASFRLK